MHRLQGPRRRHQSGPLLSPLLMSYRQKDKVWYIFRSNKYLSSALKWLKSGHDLMAYLKIETSLWPVNMCLGEALYVKLF